MDESGKVNQKTPQKGNMTPSERIKALEAELNEQARLVGMGAERELALIAQRDQLTRAVEVQRTEIDGLKADIAQMVVAWDVIPEGNYNKKKVALWLAGPMSAAISKLRGRLVAPAKVRK